MLLLKLAAVLLEQLARSVLADAVALCGHTNKFSEGFVRTDERVSHEAPRKNIECVAVGDS